MANLRITRIVFWWGSAVTALITLVALAANGHPSKTSVCLLVGCTGIAVTLAATDHGWFKAPERIGVLPRVFLILVIIWGPIFAVGYWVWPPDMFLYIKPGVELNPSTPKAFWSFAVVIRGPEPIYNALVRVDDLVQEAEHDEKIKAATSDAEKLAVGSFEPMYFGPYPEIDPSPQGIDREMASFNMLSGVNKRLRYKIYINHRMGGITEDLEMNTPVDKRDWQFRMRVWNNGSLVINCRDPRFPNDDNDAQLDLPQCFPEFQGKLEQLHQK